MHAEAERAQRDADWLEQPLLAGSALAALVRTATLEARFDEAQTYAERLTALARSGDDSDHLSWILTQKAIYCAFDGRVREVGPLLAEVKSLSQAWRRSILVVWEPGIHWMAGDVPGARESAERFVALHPESIAPRRGIGAVFATLAALEADDLEAANDSLRRAARAFGGRGWSCFAFSVDHAAAVLAHRMGRPEEALVQLRQTAVGQLASGGVIFAALAFLDQAELASQQPVDANAAREAADQLDRIAGQVDRDLYRGYAAFSRACAEVAAGRPDAAHRPAEEALAMFSGLGYRLFAGRAGVVLGRALSQADRPAAVRALERAAATFEECGAVWRKEQAQALLRGLGGQGRKVAAARTGPGALTRREREVAQLAAKGHTARQIADALFVGERTVEGHLASVYAKLGISSKVDLARRADQFGL
jgi:DNA-binding NarL/FixJ family response regulator